MGCFVAPAAFGILTTAFRKKIPKEYHIEWLNTLLLGGVAVLVVDHLASGELILSFPFLTAMKSAEDTAIMLQEIAITGTGMVLACVLVWSMMLAVSRLQAKSKQTA